MLSILKNMDLKKCIETIVENVPESSKNKKLQNLKMVKFWKGITHRIFILFENNITIKNLRIYILFIFNKNSQNIL